MFIFFPDPLLHIYHCREAECLVTPESFAEKQAGLGAVATCGVHQASIPLGCCAIFVVQFCVPERQEPEAKKQQEIDGPAPQKSVKSCMMQ